MSLTKVFPDSNAPDASGQRPEDNASAGGGAAMLGYSKVPFPSQMPARSNSDISITQDFAFTMVNQGTSLPSYDEQDDTVSSESGS